MSGLLYSLVCRVHNAGSAEDKRLDLINFFGNWLTLSTSQNCKSFKLGFILNHYNRVFGALHKYDQSFSNTFILNCVWAWSEPSGWEWCHGSGCWAEHCVLLDALSNTSSLFIKAHSDVTSAKQLSGVQTKNNTALKKTRGCVVVGILLQVPVRWWNMIQKVPVWETDSWVWRLGFMIKW